MVWIMVVDLFVTYPLSLIEHLKKKKKIGDRRAAQKGSFFLPPPISLPLAVGLFAGPPKSTNIISTTP